jgi:hypothetical protein
MSVVAVIIAGFRNRLNLTWLDFVAVSGNVAQVFNSNFVSREFNLVRELALF